jgi:elongation factor Ts
VNCETDFVAKNENFQSLVSTVTHTLFAHRPFPAHLTAEDLAKLEDSEGKSLSDAVAGSVGRLGENLVLQRGCLLSSGEEGMVCGHVYNNVVPQGDVAMGKYAALLHITPTRGSFEDEDAIAMLGQDLGQHIIGINPEVINEGDNGVSDPTKVLTKQGFVLDESRIVGDMLNENNAQVTQFVRYALGEH